MSDPHKFTEEFMVRGSEAVKKVKELIAEGNVRKVIVKNEHDKILFEIPVTAGVAVSGALTLMAPVLAALGAAAALMARVKVEVVRTDDGE
ncbi:DUF4342 domain-containing protein [Salinispira pacifica]|uniref:DUF4342 domain-containing protein n=1 Tax=Salinispira pacifica TaxID=1307761 RepID=V5WJZ4_9SPIO|nr:DUF4342 domain-containing protein [Salinispira pacifica]AHC16122.1 hypothetical protein L21SP2_2772 [Salinispira pacifica]